MLRDEIESGEWQPGEQFPNGSKIGESFGVSEIAIGQAGHLGKFSGPPIDRIAYPESPGLVGVVHDPGS